MCPLESPHFNGILLIVMSQLNYIPTLEEQLRLEELTKRVQRLQATLTHLRSTATPVKALPSSASGLSAEDLQNAEALWTFDFGLHRFTYINPRVDKLFGMRVGQALMAGPDQTSNPPPYRKFVETVFNLYRSELGDFKLPRQAIADENMRIFVRSTDGGDAQIANYVILARRFSDAGIPAEISGLACEFSSSTTGTHAMKSAIEAWENLFDSLPLPTFILGIDMRVRKANQAMVQALGISNRDECINKQCYKLAHNSAAPHPECPLMTAMERNTDVRSIIDEPHMDGTYLFHVTPVESDSGFPNSIICTACNITALRDSHRLLSENLTRLSLAQRAGEFGVWHIPLDSGPNVDDLSPIRFSREFYDILRIDKLTETSFRPLMSYWQRIMQPRDYETFLSEINKLANGTSGRLSMEFSRSTDTQSERYGVNATCRFSSEGYPIQIIGVLSDISTPIKNQKELQHIRDLHKLIAESMDGGAITTIITPGRPLMLTDPLEISIGVRRLLGLPENTPGTVGSLISRFHPDDGQSFLADLIDLALGTLPELKMQCRASDSTGQPIIVRIFTMHQEDSNEGKIRIDCMIQKNDT